MTSPRAVNPLRMPEIDIARGIGMILVVSGHMIEFTEIIYYIFLFHMPLFFIISGILFRKKPDVEFALDRTRALMVPYVSFIVVIFIADNILQYVSGIPSFLRWDTPKFDIMRIVFGGPSLVGAFNTFWFVGCLWIASIALNGLANRIALRGWLMLAMMALLYALSMVSRPELMLPHSLGTVPMAMVLLWVGMMVAPYRSRSIMRFLACAIIALACAPFLGKLDMKKVQYGTMVTPIFAIAVSFMIIQASHYIAKIAPLSKILTTIGKASLTIMFTHMLFMIHLRVFIENRFVLLFSIIVLSLAFHWILEQTAFTRRYMLGRDRPQRAAADMVESASLQTNRKSAAVT